MLELYGRQISLVLGVLATVVLAGLAYTARSSTNSGAQAQDLVNAGNSIMAKYATNGYSYPAAAVISSAMLTGKVDSAVMSGTTMLSRANTAITWTGQTSYFTAGLTGIPATTCQDVMTDPNLAKIITSVQVTGSAAGARSPGFDPQLAATDCGTTGTVAMTITFKGQP